MGKEWVDRELKYPEDRHDQTTWEDIITEVDDETFRKLVHVHESCARHEGDNVTEIRDKAIRIFTNMPREWNTTFEKLIEERRMSPKMLAFIKEKGMIFPTVEMISGEVASDFLKENGLPVGEIIEDDIVAVLNLPKQIAQFWWKGGVEEWGKQSVDVREMVMEWGWFYRRLMPVIWNATDNTAPGVNLHFDRINPPGLHDPKKYYYVWDINARAQIPLQW